MMLGYEFHEVLLPYALPSHGTDGATSARRGKMHMHLVRAICVGIFPRFIESTRGQSVT